jgi:hypothetical protein
MKTGCDMLETPLYVLKGRNMYVPSHNFREQLPLIPLSPRLYLIHCTLVYCISVSVAPSDNIALNKKTQGMDGDNTSSLAVDGNTDPHGQCTRTTSVAWWRVVLGAAYSIISVTIFTPHCCSKLHKYYII